MLTLQLEQKRFAQAVKDLEVAVASGNTVAIEGIWDSITGFFSTIGNFIDKKMSGALLAMLEIMSSKDIYTRALTPELREDLVEGLNRIKFSKQGKRLIVVPPYLNKNFLGYSKGAVTASEGLSTRLTNVLDELQAVTRQAVSGNGARGADAALVLSKAIHTKANIYKKTTSKYMGSTRTSNLRMNVAYGSPGEMLDAFDLLRSHNDVLETPYLRAMVKQVDNIAESATKISVDHTSSRDLVLLSRLMQSVAENLEFTGVLTTDYINCISSVQQHAEIVKNL